MDIHNIEAMIESEEQEPFIDETEEEQVEEEEQQVKEAALINNNRPRAQIIAPV